MNRAFLSLYAVIVFSVVLLGWGADKLWQAYNPEPENEPFEKLFFDVLDADPLWKSDLTPSAMAARLGAALDEKVIVYQLDDFAQSAMFVRLEEGGVVSVFDEQGLRSSYKRISNTHLVVCIVQANQENESRFMYVVLLTAFYLAIAIIVYFWVWPLSRDLRILQNYTQRVGDGTPGRVSLGQGSTVYSLAAAFNKMSERIDELLASHKEMTYAVSHELRTPLARMKFALAMVDSRGCENEDKNNKQLNSLREDIAEMDSLINELLAYAGFEQKNQALDFKQGDLIALVKNLVATNKSVSGDDSISCEVMDDLAGKPVACEWYLMERCLHNVIQNAYKFTHEKIRITAGMDDRNVWVRVEDDGPGILPEDAEKVFEAFVRLRHDTSDNRSGFGLGLAIVHRILKWHRGRVTIEKSTLGGAQFNLQWPNLPDNTGNA